MSPNGFRPWCPLCDRHSPPRSRRCRWCNLYLYPIRLPNGERPDDRDDNLDPVVVR